MVMLVRSIAVGAAVAAASTVLVQAAPLEFNPYTPVELNTPLTASHPAYGAKPNADCVKPVIPVDPNEEHARSMTVDKDVMNRKLREMEGSSGSDVDDLASHFGEQVEVSFTTLKEQFSRATGPKTPWPGSYWPTFQDGINHAWKSGEVCPSEKYATAYEIDATDLKNKISASNGVDSRVGGKSCSTKADCNDGGECGKREGATTGFCIPSWYGICHAWAPAALLEEEPKCNVEFNSVTFHVMDIKALLTEVYDGASIDTVFTGSRFNGQDDPATVDQYGRYTEPTRRDMGAGFFHIAMTNIMGKHQTSFVIDVAADSEVWNQPVWSYDVQTMEIVDTAETCNKYFGTASYPFNTEMAHLAYVKTTVSWAVEAYIDGALVSTGKMGHYAVSNDYEYLLELDAAKNIIGGEWVGDSKEDHPDFLWFPTSKPDISTVTSVGLSYANVQELLELSLACNSSSSTSGEMSLDSDDTTEAHLKSKNDKYGTDAPTPAPTATEGQSEETPVPTSPEQQLSTEAPEATTATPTEDTYGTDAPTPAPTATEGQSEETPVPTSPELQTTSQEVAGESDSYSPDVTIAVTTWPAVPINNGSASPQQVDQAKTDYREKSPSVYYPALQEHKMCV
ncbi:hypothetical protein PHYPSEUDO_010989 [Phytophthora pseudosyringae]|uniref:Elicitor-like transglutaminase n=1 Tax=Phytophthora pseudosyringae TaxID=221518 RepID=A0A8T1W7C3_9STRA|nr:hypothetical protein PHYPSEUDO_010989 [Phytophthora pseudosyringae]